MPYSKLIFDKVLNELFCSALKKKKPTIDWKALILSATVDLIVGIILLIIQKSCFSQERKSEISSVNKV